jgi:ferredoxin
MVSIEAKLREEAKRIISTTPDLKYIIGYEKGSDSFRVTPSFARSSADIDKFIFSPFCANNLVTHIARPLTERFLVSEKEEKKKIGIVVKGCDSRAIVQLLQENIIYRDSLVVIGIMCNGIIDIRKLAVKLEELKLSENIKFNYVELVGEKVILVSDSKKIEIPKQKIVFEKCNSCKYPTPLIYDVLIGELKEAKKVEKPYEEIKKIESLSLGERWNYWKEQFSKCIRCYACKNICPLCYCKECIAEKTIPTWIRSSATLSENLVFHLMRALHGAGRCIGCEECERVCPMNIPLRNLTKKLEKEVLEMFNYEAGIDIKAKPLFASFDPKDPAEFIL